jgi:hypothetical protein
VPYPRKLDMTWLLDPSRLGLTYQPVAKPKTLGSVYKMLKIFFLYFKKLNIDPWANILVFLLK